MARRGMVVAVPFYSKVQVREWGWTFAQLRWPMNVDLRFERVKDLPVDQARNELAEVARISGARWLFFLDEDVLPPLNCVKLLLEAMDRLPDCAIIGGVYTDKSDPPQPMVFQHMGAGPFLHWTIGRVFGPLEGVATGCSLINAELLDKIPQPWFKTVDEPRERWTEDMWFCKQAREAGFKVYAHGGILCRHYDVKTGKFYFLPPASEPYQRYYEGSHGFVPQTADDPA